MYEISNGVLYYQTPNDNEPRLVISDNEDLKTESFLRVMTQLSRIFIETYKVVQQKYFWPRMSRYNQRYVNTCEKCQRNKARQTKPPGHMNFLGNPNDQWVDMSINFLKALPEKKYGLVAIMGSSID